MPSLGFDLDILEVFEAQGVRPDIRSNTAVEDAAILSMVEHGLGVSIPNLGIRPGHAGNARHAAPAKLSRRLRLIGPPERLG